MNIKRILFILLLLSIVLALNSCFSLVRPTAVQNPVAKGSNFSALYNPGESLLNPELKVFITSETKTSIYVKIKTSELRNAIANPFENNLDLRVKYYLRNSDSFELMDTCSLTLNLKLSSAKYVYARFDVRTEPNKNYKLIVDFNNQMYNIRKRMLCDIKNTHEFNDDKYFIKKVSDSNMVFTNTLSEDERVQIFTTEVLSNDIRIEYYKNQNYIMLPPYWTNPVKTVQNPDTVFIYKIGDTIDLKKSGFYVLGRTAKDEPFGFMVTRNSSYPYITKIADMIEPMKLLCSEKEYAAIDTAANKKNKLDAYWLSLSKNENSAKDQVRVFYNRVALANSYFTNNCEGWKTDRGIIYVLLGPPSIVNITNNSEEWTYGNEQSGTTFVFDNYSRIKNDYTLRRSNTYQSIWLQVTTTWNTGKIFTVTKSNNE